MLEQLPKSNDTYLSIEVIHLREYVRQLENRLMLLAEQVKVAFPAINFSSFVPCSVDNVIDDAMVLRASALRYGARGTILRGLDGIVTPEFNSPMLPDPDTYHESKYTHDRFEKIRHHLRNCYGVDESLQGTIDFDLPIDCDKLPVYREGSLVFQEGLFRQNIYGFEAKKDKLTIVVEVKRTRDKCRQFAIIDAKFQITSYLYIPLEEKWYVDPGNCYLDATELMDALENLEVLTAFKQVDTLSTAQSFMEHLLPDLEYLNEHHRDSLKVNGIQFTSSGDVKYLDLLLNPGASDYYKKELVVSGSNWDMIRLHRSAQSNDLYFAGMSPATKQVLLRWCVDRLKQIKEDILLDKLRHAAESTDLPS